MRGTAVVMVVEHEPKIRGLLRHVLCAEGHDVLEAADAEEAIRLFEQRMPDLLLTDDELPKMDGLRLASKVRERDPNVALIVLSALGMAPSGLRGTRLRECDFVKKPFEMTRLRSAVRLALAHQSPSGATLPGVNLSTPAPDLPEFYLG